MQLPSAENQTLYCATYDESNLSGVTYGLKTVVATESMTITVNLGGDSLTYWVPNYDIPSASAYEVTIDGLEYPNWLSPYLTVSEQTDTNAKQYKTI